MKEARRASPFSSEQLQKPLEKWICRQHQQQELPPEQAQPPALQPLAAQEAEPRRPEPPAQMMQAQPSHRQYDAIISKMRNARRQAAQDQHWSG